jgi:hypothetical protein
MIMKLYRYSGQPSESENVKTMHVFSLSHVFLHEFDVVRETPCGAWIQHSYGKKRFINLRCVKQWASKTPEEAKKNFLARKKRQISILEHQLQDAKDSVIAMGLVSLAYSEYVELDYGY